MELPSIEQVNNVWQLLAFVAAVTVIVGGYVFMNRAKREADKQTDVSQQVVERVAEVPRLLATVELLTQQAKAQAADIAELKQEMDWHRKYAAWLVSLDLPKPPFLTLEEYIADSQKF